MKTLKYRLDGIGPFMMHSSRTVDPRDSFSKAMKEITIKRKKTDEDHEVLTELQFRAACYFDEERPEKGYVIPARVIDEAMYNSAKNFKLGPTYKQSVIVMDDSQFHFQHEKKTPTELYKDYPQYVDMRNVNVQGNKVVRCRPVVNNWWMETEFMIDEGRVNERQVDQIIVNAGKYIAIGTFRPRYGRFEATKID